MAQHHDLKFHTKELLKIFQKHDAHKDADYQIAILQHLKALHEVEMQKHVTIVHLSELQEYLGKTTFPYYHFEDSFQEVNLIEVLEKLLNSQACHGKLRNQFFDFIHKEMKTESFLRTNLSLLHKAVV